MKKRTITKTKNPEQAALKALAGVASKLLAETGHPVPATKLEPVIAAILQMADGVANKIATDIADQVADKLAERMEAKLRGMTAEIRLPRN